MSPDGTSSAYCYYCDKHVVLGSVDKGISNFTKHVSRSMHRMRAAGNISENLSLTAAETILAELHEGDDFIIKGGRLYCRACGRTFLSNSVTQLRVNVSQHDDKTHKENVTKLSKSVMAYFTSRSKRKKVDSDDL